MIKKYPHPVSTGIIAALLISNGVIGYQFHKDSNQLTAQLENKTEQYDTLKVNYTNKEKLIKEQESEINSQLETINKLIDEKDSLNKDVTKQKEDIVKLKEQLEQTKQKQRELP